MKNILDSIEDYSQPEVVDRCVYCAVLERAFRDITTPVDGQFRREAIAWFNGKNQISDTYGKRHITFFSCIENIPLDSKKINFLKEHVRVAEKETDTLKRHDGKASNK